MEIVTCFEAILFLSFFLFLPPPPHPPIKLCCFKILLYYSIIIIFSANNKIRLFIVHAKITHGKLCLVCTLHNIKLILTHTHTHTRTHARTHHLRNLRTSSNHVIKLLSHKDNFNDSLLTSLTWSLSGFTQQVVSACAD